MEWTNEKCLKLIEEYSRNPSLWDQTCIFYKNKLKRKEAWADMAAKFTCSKAEVERKMNVLLTQYRREKHKVLVRCYNGGEVRSSRWYAYKKFAFLENGLKSKKRAALLYNAIQLRMGNYNNLQDNPTNLSDLPTWNPSLNNNNNNTSNNSQQIVKENYGHDSDSSINNNNIIHNNNNNHSKTPTEFPIQDLSIKVPHSHLPIAQSPNKDINHENEIQINVDPNNILQSIKTSNLHGLNQNHNSYNNHNNNNNNNNNSNINNNNNNNNINHNNNNNNNNNNSINNNKYSEEIKEELTHSVHDYSMHNDDETSEQEYPIDYHNEINKILRRSSNSPIRRLNAFKHSFRDLEQHRQEIQNDFNQKTLSNNQFLFPTSSTTQNKDDCDFVGSNVAMKLRSMEESQRIIAEKLISDVLFFGQFNELDRTANICPNRN